jgi:metal-sulfur cluster biosynthetic enzyme
MPEPAPELLAQIHERLDEIKDPCSVAAGTPMGLSEMGIIGSVDMSPDGDVAIQLRLTSPFCHMIAFLTREAKARVGALPGVRDVSVTTDAGLDWTPDLITGIARVRRDERTEQVQLLNMVPSRPTQ